MTRKILPASTAVILVFLLCSAALTQKKANLVQYPIVTISGDEKPNSNPGVFTGVFQTTPDQQVHILPRNNSAISVTDIFTGVTSLYDLPSNGVPQHIEQFYTDTIHLVFMQNSTPGIPSSDRRCIYLVSANHGTNWVNLGQVPLGISSGFPVISLFNDGRAVLGLHAAVGSSPAHAVIFHDIAPLVGVFMMCDPGLLPASSAGVWVRFVTTPSDKVIFMAAINSSTANPSVYINTLTNPIA